MRDQEKESEREKQRKGERERALQDPKALTDYVLKPQTQRNHIKYILC